MTIDPVVEIKQGKLRGLYQHDVEGGIFYAFKGIPYALPPVGELRFQEPQPPASWQGIRDASKFGNNPPQYTKRGGMGNEDCLYLNVFSKNVNPFIPLPVMVWVYGGKLLFGQADDLFYGPEYLLRKDVVLVTFNYRIGVLGFLNLENDDAPGNQGLKDQIMALKWVKENISKFGGDPDNVTLFGESSGAVCVHFLCLAPASRDLFHKAILQGGSLTCPYAFTPEAKKIIYRLCEFLGKRPESSKQVVEFLKTIDCEKLVEAQQTFITDKERVHKLFAVSCAQDVNVKNPIMTEPFEDFLGQGIQMPVLIGYNARDGVVNIEDTPDNLMEQLDADFHSCLHPNVLKILEEHGMTSRDLRREYFGTDKITNRHLERYVDMMSDLFFIHGLHKVINIQKTKSTKPTYAYRFSFNKGFSFLKKCAKTNMKGASHFDDVHYLFTSSLLKLLKVEPLDKNSESYKTMIAMTDLWTSFAKTGKPKSTILEAKSIIWEPVYPEDTDVHLLDIGRNLKMQNVLDLSVEIENVHV